MGQSKKPKVPKQAAVIFEDFSEADRVFQESLNDSFAAAAPHDLRAKACSSPCFANGPKKGERAQKRQREDTPVIDLHGLTLQQATEYLDDRLRRLLGESTAVKSPQHVITVKIVTGKGLHSGPSGGVLAKEIHRHVAAVYGKHIVTIEDSPGDTMIRGLPLRGHFNVRLRRP